MYFTEDTVPKMTQKGKLCYFRYIISLTAIIGESTKICHSVLCDLEFELSWSS